VFEQSIKISTHSNLTNLNQGGILIVIHHLVLGVVMFKKILMTGFAASLAASFLLGATDNSEVAKAVAAKAQVATVIAQDMITADPDKAVSVELQQSISSLLAHKLQFKVSSVERSELPGLFEVVSDQGIFYVNADASYLLQGSLYQVNQGSAVDLTEKTMGKVRIQSIAAYADDMIVYPAKNEKYSITVFTDINCGYCRKLHSEMQDYNDLGITVKYLAFPRSGINTKTYVDMVSIWCADDKAAAMSKAKEGSSIAKKTCNNTVQEQYNLGRQLGVTGTPALILSDGSMQPGYLPAERLIKVLENLGK